MDVKGSILLAITITSFLLSITLLQPPAAGPGPATGADGSLNIKSNGVSNFYNTFETIFPFLAMGTVSLILFVYTERRAEFPLIDFKIFLQPTILFSSLIIMIVGMSMFMVFQTIPILIQTSQPIGFGENSVDTGRVQLPFAIVLLIFGPTSGFIISKLGSLKPIIFGFSYFNHIWLCRVVLISFLGIIYLNRFSHIVRWAIANCRWRNEHNHSIFTTGVCWGDYRDE